ncbi:hypothetical protein [Streptomyces axinellae]|uniref:Uncharacterized protein n=1 Tax=Streptomyces axinellae TaxID=552788 RepID=A0ABP6DD68_9ACTN
MSAPLQTPEERRRANRLRHLMARQEQMAARGPKGVAASWWDHARALAAEEERGARYDPGADPGAAWQDLARALENWCQRYSR